MGNAAQSEDAEATSPSIADTIASRIRANARATEPGGESRGASRLRRVFGFRNGPG